MESKDTRISIEETDLFGVLYRFVIHCLCVNCTVCSSCTCNEPEFSVDKEKWSKVKDW